MLKLKFWVCSAAAGQWLVQLSLGGRAVARDCWAGVPAALFNALYCSLSNSFVLHQSNTKGAESPIMSVLLYHIDCTYPLCCVCLRSGSSNTGFEHAAACTELELDGAWLEMDCKTWTSPIFSFPFQKWQNNNCCKSKEVEVWWFAV